MNVYEDKQSKVRRDSPPSLNKTLNFETVVLEETNFEKLKNRKE